MSNDCVEHAQHGHLNADISVWPTGRSKFLIESSHLALQDTTVMRSSSTNHFDSAKKRVNSAQTTFDKDPTDEAKTALTQGRFDKDGTDEAKAALVTADLAYNLGLNAWGDLQRSNNPTYLCQTFAWARAVFASSVRSLSTVAWTLSTLV